MAKGKGGKEGAKRRVPGKPPKLTDEKGKPQKPESMRGGIKTYLRDEINAALFKADLDGFIFRRNVRRALGIGDLAKYIEDFEEGFKRSGELQIKQKDTESKEELIYGEPRDNRPKVTKVSREYVLRPDTSNLGKGKPAPKGKGK